MFRLIRLLSAFRGPALWPQLIAAGVGGLMGLLGRDKRKTVTSTSTSTQDLTPEGQFYRNLVARQAADAFRTAPVMNAPLTGVLSQFGQFGRLGDIGMRALSGDYSAVQQLMNPYQSAVLDAAAAQFDKSDIAAQNAVTQRAISAGAFGNAREGVARGVAAANIARDRNSLMANLLQSGFSEAMQRAQAGANLGFNAAQQQAALGQWWQGFSDPLARSGVFGSIIGGLPWGSTTTSTSTSPNPNYQSPFNAILGGALTGFGLYNSARKPA